MRIAQRRVSRGPGVGSGATVKRAGDGCARLNSHKTIQAGAGLIGGPVGGADGTLAWSIRQGPAPYAGIEARTDVWRLAGRVVHPIGLVFDDNTAAIVARSSARNERSGRVLPVGKVEGVVDLLIGRKR